MTSERREGEGGRLVFVTAGEESLCYFFCPACQQAHVVRVPPHPHAWAYDGNEVSPTFHPSIKVSGQHPETGEPTVCHSYLRQGQFEYLADCTHAMAGRSMPLPAMPETTRAQLLAD